MVDAKKENTMYRCQITGKLSRQGDPRTGPLAYMHELKADDQARGSEKLNKIVIETREVQYRHWDREAEEEWFSTGTEIVRELNVSEAGLAIWNNFTDEQRATFVQKLKENKL